jgi:hypothetical protein
MLCKQICPTFAQREKLYYSHQKSNMPFAPEGDSIFISRALHYTNILENASVHKIGRNLGN